MSASAKCHHPETSVDVCTTYYKEQDVFVLSARVGCRTCGAQFRFRGLSPDASPVEPWVSGDGFTAALPMVEDGRWVMANSLVVS